MRKFGQHKFTFSDLVISATRDGWQWSFKVLDMLEPQAGDVFQLVYPELPTQHQLEMDIVKVCLGMEGEEAEWHIEHCKREWAAIICRSIDAYLGAKGAA